VPKAIIPRQSDSSYIQRHQAAASTKGDTVGEGELGLSLRLQITSTSQQEREEDMQENNKEDQTANHAPTISQNNNNNNKNNNQRTDLGGAGITAHGASLANRKARVSVRARCQAATVSCLLSRCYIQNLCSWGAAN
jgi:hypothetical protein